MSALESEVRWVADLEREARWLASSFAAQLTDEELARYNDDDPSAAAFPLTHAAARAERDRRAEASASDGCDGPDDQRARIQEALERLEERGPRCGRQALLESMRETAPTIVGDVLERGRAYSMIGAALDYLALFGRVVEEDEVEEAHAILTYLDRTAHGAAGERRPRPIDLAILDVLSASRAEDMVLTIVSYAEAMNLAADELDLLVDVLTAKAATYGGHS